MPTVGLFVTCVVDQIVPQVGMAAVRLLEAAGCTVEFPAEQTCCGQPACNAGEPEAAAVLARHWIDVFGGYDAIVGPSGSCVAMVHHWYPRLLGGAERERARELAARTFELTSFLADELATLELGARLDATVTVHDSCHGLRNLGVRDAGRRLLEAAGATLVEMSEPETCCGFGGTFSLDHPEIAAPLADAKLTDAAQTEARWLASSDAACLLHLEGRRRRTGAGPEPIHTARLLAAGLER
ncbi:MAG TPA: (Fe-S)-binding protein [Acidimicrobiia bacterium]|jgi:L-lactate dehydrogenase complex protein LldE